MIIQLSDLARYLSHFPSLQTVIALVLQDGPVGLLKLPKLPLIVSIYMESVGYSLWIATFVYTSNVFSKYWWFKLR